MSTVHIVYGPQGAGKSSYALALSEREQALRLSIDPWMAELFGPDVPQRGTMGWIMTRVARCESRIWQTASEVAKKGVPVVLDLGFMRASDRERFACLAAQSGLQVRRHFVSADAVVRRARVQERNQVRGATFAFEVTPDMFDAMEPQFEEPSAEELANSTVHRS
ncbi:MAG: ATP-binding protein [Comamonadaceae bacterium]|nr:ATP-binding protein [Comamonadaceae bacterium]